MWNIKRRACTMGNWNERVCKISKNRASNLIIWSSSRTPWVHLPYVPSRLQGCGHFVWTFCQPVLEGKEREKEEKKLVTPDSFKPRPPAVCPHGGPFVCSAYLPAPYSTFYQHSFDILSTFVWHSIPEAQFLVFFSYPYCGVFIFSPKMSSLLSYTLSIICLTKFIFTFFHKSILYPFIFC